MSVRTVNRVSGIVMLLLSLGAATLVLAAAAVELLSGPTVRQPDEGAAARLFQLGIAALVPTSLVFVATADWTRPAGALRLALISGAAVVLALAVLFYFENMR